MCSEHFWWAGEEKSCMVCASSKLAFFCSDVFVFFNCAENSRYVEHLCWLAPSRSQARKWRVSVHEVCSSVRDLQARDRRVKDKGLWDQKI